MKVIGIPYRSIWLRDEGIRDTTTMPQVAQAIRDMWVRPPSVRRDAIIRWDSGVSLGELSALRVRGAVSVRGNAARLDRLPFRVQLYLDSGKGAGGACANA